MTGDTRPSAPGAVDWAALRRRLGAIAPSAGGDAAARERLLRERAARYARARQPERAGVREVVVFRRADLSFGLSMQAIAAAVPVERLARIPGAAANIAGALMHEGAVVAIHDLAVPLRRRAAVELPARALVGAGEFRHMALLADEIVDIDARDMNRISPPPRHPLLPPRCVVGVHEDRWLLLDIGGLRQWPEFFRA